MQSSRFFYRDPDAPAPTEPIRIGVVALIEEDGALLMDCRADCHRWALIGGVVEMDESLTDAVAREVLEETGLTVSNCSLFGTFSDPSRIIQWPDGNTARHITLAYIVQVTTFDGLEKSEESIEIHLVPRAELMTLDIVETHRHILEAYLTSGPVVLA